MMISASAGHSLSRFVAVALLGLSGVACAVDPATTPASAPLSTQLLEPVNTLIGDAGCDNQGQCHVIGIGAKPCGGPSSYLAWSDRKTDAAALQGAVQAQIRAQIEENKRSGLMSDCRALPTPPAVCRPRGSDGKRTCQLGQGGASSAI